MAPAAKPLGRPRDAEIDARILAAARQLLEQQGYTAVTVSAVARHAGLPRSTVYRRYASHVVLRFAALFVPDAGMSPLEESGDVRADMKAHIAANAAPFRDPEGRELLRAVALDTLSDAAARRELADRFTLPRLREIADVIDRARERGDLPPGVDGDLAAKAITGALVYQALILDLPVDDAFLDGLLDLLFPVPPTNGSAGASRPQKA